MGSARWVGGVNKGQKHAYVIFEWSQSKYFSHFLVRGKFEKIDSIYIAENSDLSCR